MRSHPKADLVVVRGDPLEEIAVTREIVQVFVNGAPIARHREAAASAPGR